MKSVLVIDESASIRETLRIVLGGEHTLFVAPSWQHAATSEPPALVILGLGAPPRDAAGAAAALERLAPNAPVLVLHAPTEPDLGVLLASGRRVDFLPKPFDAYTLRARVGTLLAAGIPAIPSAGDQDRRFLEFPFLTAPAARVARQAIASDLPVLLCGERGTGALDVGRAIHGASGRGGAFTVLACGALTGAGLVPRLRGRAAKPAAGTLLLSDVDAASAQAQQEMLALVREAVDARSLRVLASCTADLEARVARGEFVSELAYALGTITISLPPLRDRQSDIPALVENLTAALAARLGLGPVTYTEEALTRLTRYLWFGNTAELEAVLGRTLALHRAPLVDAPHLLFSPTPAATSLTPAPAEVSRAAERRPSTEHRSSFTTASAPMPSLEILLGELAHELRNPMVTIKTFAQHLENVLDDPEMRARFATLASDAIARMDTLLETLLDFARFRAPRPQPTDIRALLERALGDHRSELERKSVRIERNGTGPTFVTADEAQVLFALRTLVDGIVGSLIPHQPLHVRQGQAGALELVVRAERGTAERLASYVEGGEDTNGEPAPLPVALAAALIRRNGGSLRMRAPGDGTTVITMTLPRAGAEDEEEEG